MRAGELDYIVVLGFKDVAALQKQPRPAALPDLAGDRFIFNNSKPPFDNKPLRQALQLAIDRPLIHRTIYFETAIGHGPSNSPSWAFDPIGSRSTGRPRQGPARLKEGGPGRVPVQADGLGRRANRQIAEAYQAMFAPLGVKVTIDQVEGAKRSTTSSRSTTRLASRTGR